MSSKDDINCHFNLRFTILFGSQVDEFDNKTKRIIEEKIKVVRANPFQIIDSFISQIV